MIKVDYNSIVYRNYSDFGVVYNLQTKSVITLKDVALDIFDFIFSNKEIQISDVIKHISELYEVEYEIVNNDVTEFINTLIVDTFLLDVNKSSQNIIDNNVLEEDVYNDLEGQIISTLQKRNQLFSATIELTYLCNEKCVHCYATYCNNDTNPIKELDVEKCKSIIDELKNINCCHINFTGGDPFMFKGFGEVFSYARKQNFVCSIYTNGQTMSADKKLTDFIASYIPRTIYISLYGSTAEVHDKVTQVKGSFDKTIDIAKYLINKNISIVFQMMILTINHHQIKEMIELAEKIGADYRVGLSIINKNNGDSSPQEFALKDIDSIKEILSISSEKFMSMDKESVVNNINISDSICGAGTTAICISPNGNVYPCVSLKILLGNVYENSIEHIWNSNNRKKILDELIWRNTEKCSSCEYIDYCPHCVGISHLENGNPLSCNNCDFLLGKALYELNNL